MIEAINLRKTFGNVVAVDDVSFLAEDGAITGLLGRNGAGKTTTMRMLYSLMQPDRGKALVDGLDARRQPTAVRARLGVLPDLRGIYPRLSARENIRYYGELCDVPADALDKRIDVLLELLDMTSVADRRTAGFSQGERMKVAIARALVHEPSNVLLDEPTTGLDVMSTRALRRLIRRLRDEGCCVVLSSHVMQEVAALCDSIVIVADGKVVATGSPDELRAQTGFDSLEEVFVRLTTPEQYLLEDE